LICHYEFKGYQAYQKYYSEIQQRVEAAMEDTDLNYLVAINEAVCNAAKYSVNGPLNAEIRIKLKIEKNTIQTTIFSHTETFNIPKYREELQLLAKNKETQQMEWGDWSKNEVSGRGFWYMLVACDFILVHPEGQYITLHTSLPFRKDRITNCISRLVPRFFIENKGVIQ
jgi:anti-sigma regulatory factor (Ser/Thr protein kinase)